MKGAACGVSQLADQTQTSGDLILTTVTSQARLEGRTLRAMAHLHLTATQSHR